MPKVGDFVRVTIEDFVSRVDAAGTESEDFSLSGLPAVWLGGRDFRGFRLEVLPKPVKVGDFVSPSKGEADSLPVGSVIAATDTYMRTKAGWINARTGAVYPVADMAYPRRVIYIAESAA